MSKRYEDYAIDEAWDAETVMKQMKENEYELVLMDLMMPDSDPNTLLHWIKNFCPQSKVLVLSMSDEALFGMRVYTTGGCRLPQKRCTASGEMISALETVMSGKKYVSKELAETILDNTLNGKSVNPFERLFPREFSGCDASGSGLFTETDREMLQIQYATVNTFKLRIFEKLDIGSQRELMQLASAYSFGGK